MQVEVHCGGIVDTNGYLISREGKGLAVDAPEGMLSWLRSRSDATGVKMVGLLLTHGHWDHTTEAAAIQRGLRIPVLIHRDSAPLLENPEIQAAYTPSGELEACRASRVVDEEKKLRIAGFEFALLHCPGHCPGSLAFYFAEERMLFGGDVLFAGGVGRSDLPGGSEAQLMESIEKHILTLSDETRVYPGHGPATTVGRERRTNPFLQGIASRR